MNFFKRIFDSNQKVNDNNEKQTAISIKVIERYTDRIEVGFNVPSKKLYYISIEKDSFTKEKIIKFVNVASYSLDKLITWGDSSDFVQLCIGLRNQKEKDLLTFSTYQKTLKFKQGDKIALLFENEEIKEFELIENGIRIDKDNEGIIIESYASIDSENLDRLKNIRLMKWRHIPHDSRKPETGTLSVEQQNDIIEMSRVYSYVFENPIE
jgi:hypothetical protein